MRKSLRNALIVSGATALGASMLVAPSAEATTYSPGTATAYKPTYVASTARFSYHCSFAHWRSGAKVSWTCNLQAVDLPSVGYPLSYSVIAKHSGSWTPGSASYTTATWTWPKNIGQSIATEVTALSVDGGVDHYSAVAG